jgi:hypothetical protein
VTRGRLLLLTIGCTSFLPGVAHARLGISAFQQQTGFESAGKEVRNQPRDAGEARTPDGQKRSNKDEILAGQKKVHSPAPVKNRPPSLAAKTKERSKQLPNTRKQFPSEGALKSQQHFSDKSGRSARTQIVQRQTATTAASPRTPTVIRAVAPLLSNVRHRGANPAMIGGSAHASSKDTSAISGTTVHRRP